MRRVLACAASALLALVVAGCGSGGSAGSGDGQGDDPGTVKVLAAGSLVNLFKDVEPGFEKATGGDLQVETKGSTALANEIRGETKQVDVFVSASKKANKKLLGKENGDWESWYANFAKSPLLIGYNPKSKYVKALTSQPWNTVISKPGFRMGATDPETDPKGERSVKALKAKGIGDTKLQIFPEEQLLARLQSANLDAGFFYSTESADANLPTVPLTGLDLGAEYTVTVVNRAPNAEGAAAFVRYFLGDSGRKLLTKHGVQLTPYSVDGDKNAVPKSLAATLNRK